MRYLTTLVLALLILTPAFADEKAPAKEKPWEPHRRTREFPWMSTKVWDALHDSFVKRGKAGKVGVLFLGDSITQGWGGAQGVWKENFGKLDPANFGIGGDTTQNVLWRITKGGELEGVSPKVVVLMIGTNNFGIGNDTAADVAKGVEAVVKAIRGKAPKAKVLLLGIFPRDAKPDTDFRKRVADTNKALAKIDDKAVTFLDIGGEFLDKDGNLPKEIMPDALHLSEKGYAIWAKAIKEPLAKLLKE